MPAASPALTRTPSSARATAGSSRSAAGIDPPSSSRLAQPDTAPGTVTERGPVTGTGVRIAADAEPCAPLALTLTTDPSGRRTSANRSPPTEHMCG